MLLIAEASCKLAFSPLFSNR